jgi:Terminase large subunit, T4likevirus-type, N-terminal
MSALATSSWLADLNYQLQNGQPVPEWVIPERMFEAAAIKPDKWQLDFLNCLQTQVLMLCARQIGKSLAVAALTLRTALVEAPASCVIFAPSDRQSKEFLRYVYRLWYALGRPYHGIRNSDHEIELKNGSRILALPESERTTRGIATLTGVNLLVLDEAARVDDELYYAVRPMLADEQARLIALSTPFGKRGWFFSAWKEAQHALLSGAKADWHLIRVTARQCPRKYPPAKLDKERRSMPARQFRQEFRVHLRGRRGPGIPPGGHRRGVCGWATAVRGFGVSHAHHLSHG